MFPALQRLMVNNWPDYRSTISPNSCFVRHRAFRHRWSELMMKSILPGWVIVSLRGNPPPRLAASRSVSRTVARFFSDSFLFCQQMQPKGCKTAALATPKTNKNIEMSSGWNPEKIANMIEKWKPWDLGNHDFPKNKLQTTQAPPCSKRLTKCVRKGIQNGQKIYKIWFWM